MTSALAGPVAFDLFVPAQGDYSTCPSTISLKEVAVAEGENNALLWLNYCKAAIDLALRAALDIDLLHCHDWMTVIAGIKLRQLLNKPLVFNVHLPQVVKAYQTLEQLGLLCADLVLVNSVSVADEIRARDLPVQRIEIVPNGVDLESFTPSCTTSDGAQQVLFVGRLVPQKGVAVLLQAFRAVLARCPDAKLVIAGDGEMELFLKRVASYLGIRHRVSFVSWQTGTSLVELYRKATCVVIPSFYEPFGIVALEAMACGCPVVASSTGGLREIVNDGVNGYLVPIGEYLPLAQRIASLLLDRDRRAAMAVAARARAAEYSWRRSAEQTLDLYERVISGENGSILPEINRQVSASIVDTMDDDARRIMTGILN
jgi:glycosyltransferase involved in cell wall biosynthesis